MRYAQAEKMEIIRLVEGSALSVTRTVEELGIHRSTFYAWYRRFLEDGYDGLADRTPTPNQFWNKIPEPVKEQVVDIALDQPEKSPGNWLGLLPIPRSIISRNRVSTGF